jgi:hypothetical protein
MMLEKLLYQQIVMVLKNNHISQAQFKMVVYGGWICEIYIHKIYPIVQIKIINEYGEDEALVAYYVERLKKKIAKYFARMETSLSPQIIISQFMPQPDLMVEEEYDVDV